jgi:hypothetical protein
MNCTASVSVETFSSGTSPTSVIKPKSAPANPTRNFPCSSPMSVERPYSFERRVKE